MKIGKETFVRGIAAYIDTEIMPKTTESLVRWFSGAVSGTLLVLELGRWYDEVADYLRGLNLADEKGNIDYDFLKEFFEKGFKAEEVITLNPEVIFPNKPLLHLLLPKNVRLNKDDAKKLFEIFMALKAEENGNGKD